MILILGASASGKTTLAKKLELESPYERIVTYTTRPIRPGEVDGVDYHFISEYEFEDMICNDEFGEYTKYNGWYYGSTKKSYVNNGILVIEPVGFRSIKRNCPLVNMTSVYLIVDENIRLSRLALRGDNITEIFRRIFSDQGTFNGLEDEVDICVYNENENDMDASIKMINIAMDRTA